MDASTPTSSTPVAASSRNMAALREAVRTNAPRKPWTCSGFPFGRNGATNGLKPMACIRSSAASTICGSYQLVNASWTSTTLRARSLAGEGGQSLRRGDRDPACRQFAPHRHGREFRRMHQTDHPHGRTAGWAAEQQIIQSTASCRAPATSPPASPPCSRATGRR